VEGKRQEASGSVELRVWGVFQVWHSSKTRVLGDKGASVRVALSQCGPEMTKGRVLSVIYRELFAGANCGVSGALPRLEVIATRTICGVVLDVCTLLCSTSSCCVSIAKLSTLLQTLHTVTAANRTAAASLAQSRPPSCRIAFSMKKDEDLHMCA